MNNYRRHLLMVLTIGTLVSVAWLAPEITGRGVGISGAESYGCGHGVEPTRVASDQLLAQGAQPQSREFPLFLYGVHPNQVGAVQNFVDVVYVNTAFVPYDPTARNAVPGASLAAPLSASMLDAAAAHDVSAAIQIPIFGNRRAADESPPAAVIGDGVLRFEDGKYRMYDPTGTVRIPLENNEITAQFIEWVMPQVRSFIRQIVAHPNSDRLKYWWGIEEIRYWNGDQGDYGLERRIRAAIEELDPQRRPLVSYMGGIDDPPKALALSILAGIPGASRPAPSTPAGFDETTVTLTRADPAWRGWDINTHQVQDIYPVDLRLWLQDKQPVLIHDHVMAGNYVPQYFGGYAQQNRIWSYHQVQRQLEAIGDAQAAYLAATEGEHLESLDEAAVFHMPYLGADL